MSHVPFDEALPTDTEKVRAIIALCQQLDDLVPGRPTDAVRHKLQAIEGIACAFIPRETRRDLYCQVPVKVTGWSIQWRFPKLPTWVKDEAHP